jgi:hypothetical protein
VSARRAIRSLISQGLAEQGRRWEYVPQRAAGDWSTRQRFLPAAIPIRSGLH